MDSQLSSHLLSLTEYSNKYHMSISTLRRRIRTGQFPFSIKFGKYFLEDQSPAILGKLKVTPQSNTKKTDFNKKKIISKAAKNKPVDSCVPEKQWEEREKNIKKDPFSILPQKSSLLDKLMDSQKELCSQIERKDLRINEQQNQIADLNTLVALLEKENKELKSLLYQEKEMEEWLEIN